MWNCAAVPGGRYPAGHATHGRHRGGLGDRVSDYILAVRVVDSLEDAMTHIAQYGTGHSECIVTDSARAAEAFLDQVDAAAVYLNASTRFLRTVPNSGWARRSASLPKSSIPADRWGCGS